MQVEILDPCKIEACITNKSIIINYIMHPGHFPLCPASHPLLASIDQHDLCTFSSHKFVLSALHGPLMTLTGDQAAALVQRGAAACKKEFKKAGVLCNFLAFFSLLRQQKNFTKRETFKLPPIIAQCKIANNREHVRLPTFCATTDCITSIN
jgi:hypothetical protein